MNIPLTRSQFSLAIGQGRGRALMHAKQFGIRNVTDLVLEACLDTPPVTVLSSFEADWLFAFFKGTSEYESISDEFLNHVVKKDYTCEDDYFICEQHCNITALIAQQGNKRAEKILRDFVLNQSLGEHLDWCGVAALHSLGYKEDALYIAQRTGQSLKINSEYEAFRDYYYLLGLYHYHKLFDKTLLEQAQEDDDIKIYLEAFGNAKKEEVNYWKERDSEDWQQRMQEQYPFEKILAMAYDRDNEDWHRVVNSRSWSDKNELYAIAKCILSEKDDLILCRLMSVFENRPLPEFDPAFFRFAYSTNSEIRSKGLRLLSANHDEMVGDFGRDLLEDIDYVEENPEVFGMFNANFKQGDEIKIISVLENLGATPEKIYSLPLYPDCSLNGTSGLVRLLVWLYEHQPCPAHREDLTLRMFNCKAFTKDLATECLYDAAQRTRETAEAWMDGDEIPIPHRLWFRKGKELEL